MGVANELRLMRRSFSGDASRGIQSRSGDDRSNGAPLFDFVASVQSAEADIIEEEERAERRESKRQFVRLLRLYFKKILSDQERKFLSECLRSKQTPYKIGRALGLDYRKIIENVQRKYEATAPQLSALMRASGYDCRRGIEFFPTLVRYCVYRERYYFSKSEEIKRKEKQRYKANPERRREIMRRYKERHKETVLRLNRNCYRRHSDIYNARRRAKYAVQKQPKAERVQDCDIYKLEELRQQEKQQAEFLQAKAPIRSEAERERRREAKRRYKERHKETVLRANRNCYRRHRDIYNARRRAKYAAQKQAQQNKSTPAQ